MCKKRPIKRSKPKASQRSKLVKSYFTPGDYERLKRAVLAKRGTESTYVMEAVLTRMDGEGR